MVQDVCRLLAEELPLEAGAPGGMVEYRRTLTTSFFFKFYLAVQMQLQAMVRNNEVKNTCGKREFHNISDERHKPFSLIVVPIHT